MLSEHTPSCHVLGADVAKDTITFYSTRTGQTITLPNQRAALRAHLRQHKDQRLVLEATGGYEAMLIDLALALNVTVYRVNPSRVRAFMRAIGQQAKTDAIDARALAEFGRIHGHSLRPFAPPPAEQKALQQLVSRRDDLIQMRTQERNRLQAPDNTALLKSISAVLACLEEQVKAVEAQIKALMQQSAELSEKKEVLTAVSGVGHVTAHNLLAALPELGQLNGKQIAALAGLAPWAKDSGTKSAYRRTGKGRTNVRRILFMAAFAASRFHPVLKEFYDRLRQNGKKPMQALVAVARKLLVILNAKIRDHSAAKNLAQQS